MQNPLLNSSLTLFHPLDKPTLLIMINHVSEIKAINLLGCDDHETRC